MRLFSCDRNISRGMLPSSFLLVKLRSLFCSETDALSYCIRSHVGWMLWGSLEYCDRLHCIESGKMIPKPISYDSSRPGLVH